MCILFCVFFSFVLEQQHVYVLYTVFFFNTVVIRLSYLLFSCENIQNEMAG